MIRTKTISRILAGVSAVALTATIGSSLARAGENYNAGPYASITQAFSTDFIIIDALVNDDVTVASGIGVGANETAIDVLGDTVINGELHNGGTVYATGNGDVEGISVAGGAFIHDGIHNVGHVSAVATRDKGGDVSATGIDYDVVDDVHAHSTIVNDHEIHADAILTGGNGSANAIGVDQEAEGTIAETSLVNTGWIDALADASSADIYDNGASAAATAFGVAQVADSYDLDATAHVDNHGDIFAAAYGDASSFVGDSSASALVAGISQEVASGFDGEATVENAAGARIDVDGHATASAGYNGELRGDGSAYAAAGGAGIFQFVHGQFDDDEADTSAADIVNVGEVDVNISATADAYGSEIAAYATGGGVGALQLVLSADEGEISSHADLYNEGTIALGVHAVASAEGMDVYHTSSYAQALALGVGQVQGALSLGGEAHTQMHNDGGITADIDAVATADIATAFALGAGSLQAAVGAVAYASLTNDNFLQADVDATADGTEAGIAIGVGMGAAQLALSLGGSGAIITNEGTIDLDVTADATSDFLASANALALGGALQVAGSLLGEAHASMTNTSSESIDVDGMATAEGWLAHADSYVIGAGQVALSLSQAKADIDNRGAIHAHADSTATGYLGWADADVSAVDQLLLAFGEAYASIDNALGATIHAEANASAEGVYGIGIAGAAGINQYGAASELYLDIVNNGTISAEANASGFGPLEELGAPAPTAHAEAGAIAEARAVIQAPLSAAGVVSLVNSGDITADATATGHTGSGAIAEGHVIRPPTDVIEAALDTAASFVGGGFGAGLIGPGTGPMNAPGLPLLVGDLPLDDVGIGLMSGGGQGGIGGAEFAPIIAGIAAMLPGWDEIEMNVNIVVHNTSTGSIEASASAESGARAVGAWYQAGGLIDVTIPSFASDPGATCTTCTNTATYDVTQVVPGALSGIVTNDGIISASAMASDVDGLAEAFGVVEVSAGENITSLINTGTIRAYAEGAVPSATGIAVASFQPEVGLEGGDDEGPDAQAVIENSGGLILAGIKTADNPVRRGNAINTRGNITNIRTYPLNFEQDVLPRAGFAPVVVEVDDLMAAPNEVVVNLKGGEAGSDGKAHAFDVISHELKSAYGNLDSMGFIYGDIQLTEDDVINVTEGLTMFDGVINNPGKLEPAEVILFGGGEDDYLSELNINNDGTLVMLQNKDERASRGYVHDLHIGNSGGDHPDDFSNGTLVYELTSSNAEGDYSQIFADEADITNGKFVAIYRAGHYENTTIYENIIDVADLEEVGDEPNLIGTFASVDDNSLLLNTEALYENLDETDNVGQNVDLKVTRTAFNAVAGQTHNQQAVGGGIEKVYDGLDSNTPFGQLVNSMFTVGSVEDYNDFLDQLSGAEYAQQLQSVLWSTRGLNRVITERMECTDGSVAGGTQTSSAKVGDNTVMPTADAPMASTGCFEPGQASVWMRGTGQWTSLSGDDEAPGLDETQYSILFGADYSFDENWFAGIAGGYFNSNGDFEDWGGRSGGSSEYDGLQIAAYGGYDNSTYYLRGVLAYGNYDGSVDRSIDTTELVQGVGTAGHLSGDPSSDVFSFYGETGYRFAVGGAGNITPFAGLSLASATLDGFTESDGSDTGAALKVDNSDADSVASVLGLRLDADMAMSSGVFTPSVSVAWMHEFGDTEQTVDASFADAPGSDFSVIGSEVARDSVLVDAGANFAMDDTFDLGVFYSGQFNENYSANAVSARLGYRF